MTAILPAGIGIVYGVQFSSNGETVTATTDDHDEWLGSPAAAVTHALHLRALGYRDAHVVHDMSGRVGWRPVHLLPAGTESGSTGLATDAARVIASILEDHVELDDDNAASIAFFAVQLAEQIAATRRDRR
jgi:hypothetical protein